MDRYKVIEESVSAHCCFEATVVDLDKPNYHRDSGELLSHESVCETFMMIDAYSIAELLNAYNDHTLVLSEPAPKLCQCGQATPSAAEKPIERKDTSVTWIVNSSEPIKAGRKFVMSGELQVTPSAAEAAEPLVPKVAPGTLEVDGVVIRNPLIPYSDKDINVLADGLRALGVPTTVIPESPTKAYDTGYINGYNAGLAAGVAKSREVPLKDQK